MKQLITALQKIAELAPERRHAKAPRGDALARQRIGQIARAVLAMTIAPAGERARQYSVEMIATNRTTLVSWQGKARNRAHALAMAFGQLGDRSDVASVTIAKVGGSSRGKGAESARAIAERAREGERAVLPPDTKYTCPNEDCGCGDGGAPAVKTLAEIEEGGDYTWQQWQCDCGWWNDWPRGKNPVTVSMEKPATGFRLTRDVTAGFGPGAPGYEATYPAGTEVVKVQGGLGASFAIASEALVREKTNPHDAKHRYVFVPADAVEPA